MKHIFNNPFEFEGDWFKGNLHTHSTMSDGTRTPEQVIEIYQKARYDFLSITDHGILTETEGLESGDMLLMPGEEICVGASEVGTYFHIVGVNIDGQIPISDFDRKTSPQKAIDTINRIGGIAIVAHPYWSGLNHQDLIDLKDCVGIEVYNATCDIMRNLGLSAVHVDGLIAAGKKTLLLASDDHHGEDRELRPLDACQAWMMVKTVNLDVESLLYSIKKGLFYSSMGPEIKDIKLDGAGITVETSPVKTISFVSSPALGDKYIAEDEPLTKITYPGREGETYVRVEVTDYEGKTAWSNPIYNQY